MAVVETVMGELAQRYSSALYEAADEAKVLDAVEADVQLLANTLRASPELRQVLRNPLLDQAVRTDALLAIAEKAEVGPLMRNFIRVLGRSSRLQSLPGILETFLNDLRRRRGEISVKVRSAHPLSETQQNTLADAIKGSAGSQVSIDLTVDPDLLGGLIVQVGSRLIDASVRTRLNKMHLAMKGPR